MAHKLISCCLLLFFVLSINAQTTQDKNPKGPLPKKGTEKSACTSNAGTISFDGHTGQSNDVSLDTIYLCFGDRVNFVHDGNADLSGDPDPNTTPGIGYAIYDCLPTVGGITLTDVIRDACLNHTTPIDIGGVPTPQTDSIWVLTDQINGDIEFNNNGFIQQAFNNGDPLQLFFAPITVDDFNGGGTNGSGYETDPVTGELGPCINVNTEDAFSIVFLNQVQETIITNNSRNNGCSGQFSLTGGLPEFDDQSFYQVGIALQGDPQVQGELLTTTKPRADDAIEFFVPEPGVYNVFVEDGVSCGQQFTIDMSGCEAVTFNINPTNIPQGDTVCIPLTVSDFTDILSFQGEINWDTTIIDFVRLENINTDLLGFTPGTGINLADVSSGFLSFLWFSTGGFTGVDLDDGTVLFDMCFEGIGPDGAETDIFFDPTFFEIVKGSNSEELGYVLNNGRVAVSENQLFVSYQVDSIICFGDGNGGFSVTVADGIAPYQIDWTQLETASPRTGSGTILVDGGNAAFTGLPGGQYEVTITDAAAGNPAVQVDTITINSPPSLGLNIITTLPNCAGESTGSVRTELIVGGQIVNNPSNEYTFNWNVTSENVTRLDSVASGQYRVTVVDSKGCTVDAAAAIADPPSLNLDVVIDPASCPGISDGAIDVTPNGGTGPYTFNWQAGLEAFNGTFTSSRPTPLSSGTYFVTVTDANNCSVERSYTVGNDKTLSVNAVVEDITCNGLEDGRILVTGTSNNPEPPFGFQWSTNGTFNNQPNNTATTSELSGMAPGIYYLTLTDSGAAACEYRDSFEIVEPAPIQISVANITRESCLPGNDGEVIVSVTGGTYPYNYDWNNGDMDSIASNLVAGNYQLDLLDGNSCRETFDVSVAQFDPPNITMLADDVLACPDDTDGVLSVTAVQVGEPIVGYSWSNGRTGETISNLPAGTYIVTVTAGDGCEAIDTALVIAPDALQIDSIVGQAPTCPGDPDGSLTVFASGGTTPYLYVWDNQPQNDTLSFNLYPALSAGTYSVTVVDANNCSSVASQATLSDPAAIEAQFNNIQDVSCFEGTNDGAATVAANYEGNARQGLFTFRWESGETTPNDTESQAVQLGAGFQQITITDSDGCFLVDSVEIPSPPEIIVNVNATSVTCNGFGDGTIQLGVSGGTMPFNYLWTETGETGSGISGLEAGVYNAIISDANGCSKTQQVEISEPAALSLTIDLLETRDPVCSDTEDGTIGISINDTTGINPLGPAPFTWSGGIALPDATKAEDLAAGTYGVTVTDTKGCQDSISYSLTAPPPITAVIPQPPAPRCFGEFTLITIESISGGNGRDLFDYTYTVDNNGLDFLPDQPAQVFAGVHIIQIEDQAGCTYEDTLTITQPDPIQVAFSPSVIEIELGDSTQRLTPIITSSLPIDSFLWSPGDFLSAVDIQRPLVNALDDREYTLRVVDINGCIAEGSVVVEVDKNRNVYIPNIFTPDGDGSGLNEEFRIFACNGVQNINFVRLFDRWGNQVVDQSNLPPGCEGGIPVWDGRFNGKVMNAGVYIYLIEVEFLDGITLLYRGDVTLIR
jgi:gliding motility-associated-like protein